MTPPAVPVADRLHRLVRSLMWMVWVLALVGPMIMIAQHSVSERIAFRYAPAIDEAHRASSQMYAAQSDLRLYHRTEDPEVVADFPQRREASLRHLERLRDRAPGEGARELAVRADEAARAWWDDADRTADLVREGRPSDLAAPGAHFTEFTDATSELLSGLEDRRRWLRDVRQAIVAASVLLGLAAMAAVTVYGRRRQRRATESIVAPIQALDQVVARQRAGEEDARADEGRGPTEVRTLAAELNSMLDQTREFEREQVHLTTMQSVTLRAGQRLRETSVVAVAVEAIVRDIAEAVRCDLCVLRYRAPSGEEVTRFHTDPAGPYAALGDDEVVRLLPATPPEPSAHRTVVNPSAMPLGGPRSMMIVPIRLGRERLGSIVVADEKGPHPWRGADTSALELIAGKVARTLFERVAYEAERENVRQLRELDRQKDAFVSTVSHELRTPLTSISGYAEMLAHGAAGELTPEQLRLVEVIDRNTHRLQGIIEDILLLSTIEANDARAAHHEVDMAAVAQDVGENLLPVAGRKDVDLVVVAPHPAPVEGDPAHLERALTNLVANAVKFTPGGGRVRVSVATTDGRVVATVEDSGIGIPAAQVPELFNRFYRASNAETASIPGTGLGLSIVRQIAVEHRGTVRVTSREGEGSTFHLDLPAAGSADAEPADSAEEPGA